MSTEPAFYLRIEGVVQGVGFRENMCREALRLGVRGWVRNRRDGTVEAVAVGPAAACDALIAWARRGPRAARVDRLEVRPASHEEIISVGAVFERRPTV